MILAIDFDGTIVEHAYPHIGPLRKDAKEVINKLHDDGHYIIIWTCRTDKEALDAVRFLEYNEIHFDKFNEHHPDVIKEFGGNARKILGDFYIDDRAINGLPSWEEIYHIIYHKTNEQSKSNV